MTRLGMGWHGMAWDGMGWDILVVYGHRDLSNSCSSQQANANRDALAKTLYLRMLSAIVRRCNCSRKSTTEYHNLNASSAESLTKSHDRLSAVRSQEPDEIDISEKFAFLDEEENWFGIADVFGFDISNVRIFSILIIVFALCPSSLSH